MDKLIEITKKYKNTLKEKNLAELDKTEQFKPTPKKLLWHFDDSDSVGVRDSSQELDVVWVDDPDNDKTHSHTDYSKSWAQIFVDAEEARWFDNREYYSEEEEEENEYESDYDYDSEEDEYYRSFNPVKIKDDEE